VRTRLRQAGLIAAAVALTLSGCASPTPTRSPASVPGPTFEASASLAAPSASPEAPSPSPSDLLAGWTKPVRIGLSTCNANGSASVGIDLNGAYHIAAGCDGRIRYLVSTGGEWVRGDVPAPQDRQESDPRLAFEGNTVYLANTRSVSASCGDLPPDSWVYYRQRTLPDTAWSAPVQLGVKGYGLQSFRQDRGTVFATVRASGSGGKVYFETRRGSDFHRYLISGAVETAMRIGEDGAARVAYTADGAVRFGRFTGSGFSSESIAGTERDDYAPVLVLDKQDHAHILWTRALYRDGCRGPSGGPDAGTYYATNASGTWKTERITTDVGFASLQVDDATGHVDVLVVNSAAVRHFTNASKGSWTITTLATDLSGGVASSAIARDPVRGTLLAVWLRYEGIGGIFFATKG
jgi:hypothetical protein